jgi:hypothetical protein
MSQADDAAVSFLTFEAPGTDDAVMVVVSRLGEFATEHDVGTPVHERLTDSAGEVVAALARAAGGARPGPIRVEADVGDGQLQVVVARDVDSSAVADETVDDVGRLHQRCDEFSAQRADGTDIQVWMCFHL